jgi:hypothetical protein
MCENDAGVFDTAVAGACSLGGRANFPQLASL